MQKESQLYIALPMMNESENIVDLLNCLHLQSYKDFELVVCVNQYDSWWEDQNKELICIDNQKSIAHLVDFNDIEIKVIDCSSKGRGWPKKKGGVGWARKTIMDDIASRATKNDIIVSIDADTYYPPDYLKSIKQYFEENIGIHGVAIPYYHRLNNDETDSLILRYEIYMRYYMLNMIRINNPYCYTAIGSAMAFPVWAYKKVGGLTPVAAGEDFYFLQKLAKSGNIGLWLDTIAYPSPRLSDRVAFGTGPALIKGKAGNWSSYPNYNVDFFTKVQDTYHEFSNLYIEDVGTSMDLFFIEQFGVKNIWEPLRRNYKDIINFEKACVNKVDGLRILQYLRWQHEKDPGDDENNIMEFLMKFYKSDITLDLISTLRNLNYQNINIQMLSEVRDFLFNIEMQTRKTRLVTNKYNYA